MSRPTRSTVTSWDVMVLLQSAKSLETTAENLRTQTRTMADAPMNVTGWSGKSRRACEDRTASDRDEINKLGTELNAAARVLHDTAAAISPNRSTALTKALGLEFDKFSVSDDWTVRDARDYAAELKGVDAGSAAEQSILNDQAKRAEEAKTATLSLQSLADQIGEDDRNGARALNVVFGNAEISAPLRSSFSAGQASRDVQAIMSGTATPEQKERFYRATSSTPEQRAALARGEEAVISKEQFDYLKAIYTPNWGQSAEGSAPYSLDALKRFGDEYSGAERSKLKNALGDGIYMLGNPNLRTDQQVEPTFLAGPLQQMGLSPESKFVSGGMGQLSSPIREVLTNPAASKANVTVPDTGPHSGGHRPVTDLKTFNDLKTVMDILEHRSVDTEGGSTSVQLGSDVDRALVARAGEIAAVGGDELVSNPGLFNPHNVSKTDAEALMIRMLDVAGSDHIAIHDAVLAATGGATTGSMPSVYDVEGREQTFKDAESLKHLFTFDWTDGAGNESSGVNKLFNWMPGAAYAADGSSLEALAESERAGQIATSLTQYFGDNKEAFIDIGDDKSALGELNGELARTLASAIGPHTAVMGGADPRLFDSHGVAEVDLADLKATFQILNSDADAGRIVNSMTALQIDVLQEEFGRNPHDYGLGEVTGRLEGAMASGLDSHIEETKVDGRHLAARDAAARGAMFESAYGLLSAVPGLDPAVRVLLGGVAPQAQLHFSGLPTDPDTIIADPELQRLRTEMYTSQIEPNAKYAQILEGYFSSHPEIADDPDFRKLFAPDGEVDFEEMKRTKVMPEVADVEEAASYAQRLLKSDINSFALRHNENFEHAYKR
ncbi:MULTISPECIES: hypothetical protein [Gordonia]|uniref:TPR repeat domain-containing protein n=1 Tax=Gordonia amicalis TaxID=89053 RepID=A0AAE4R5F5_9ACTN|nr:MULTISPECIES: hypothetical protein [Gordonia]ATD70805.1 hypothetical protein CNO18_11550 [Gordonia sp. 1D]MCZ0913270.1 hypothetical protein [Gordonia amicalis]MCZ4577849.1 hypothetical protein [Gordonia amicalis]MCZ4652469.1 hypothetical protein [Gordonia amicalis]MDJ0451156.1 hypothetical protein [Gordonia amicalis]